MEVGFGPWGVRVRGRWGGVDDGLDVLDGAASVVDCLPARGLAPDRRRSKGNVRSREGGYSSRSPQAYSPTLLDPSATASPHRKKERTSKHLCEIPLARVRPTRDQVHGRLHALLRLTPVEQVEQDGSEFLSLHTGYDDPDVIKVVSKVFLVEEASSTSVGGRDGVARLWTKSASARTRKGRRRT